MTVWPEEGKSVEGAHRRTRQQYIGTLILFFSLCGGEGKVRVGGRSAQQRWRDMRELLSTYTWLRVLEVIRWWCRVVVAVVAGKSFWDTRRRPLVSLPTHTHTHTHTHTLTHSLTPFSVCERARYPTAHTLQAPMAVCQKKRSPPQRGPRLAPSRGAHAHLSKARSDPHFLQFWCKKGDELLPADFSFRGCGLWLVVVEGFVTTVAL
jgi:hypothetical protein